MELDQYTDAVNLINEQEISEETGVNDDVDGTIFSRKKMAYSLEQLDVQNTNEPKDPSGFMVLHQAVQENDTDRIQELVSIGCDVNAVDPADGEEQTPLHKAAMYGHKKSVKLLLENNANANQHDKNGHTPIQTAIIYGGDFQVIEALIEKTDLLKEDKNGQNVLHVAVKFHQVDVINLILGHEQVAALIASVSEDGFTPLHLAVSLGHLDTVESFLNKLSIDITTTVSNGKNVLHLAAMTNNLALMVLLLKSKDASCLINQPDSQMITPLHDAARCGQLNQVTLLLDKGAMASITSDGYSPLHYACQEGHLTVAKKLLERHPFQKDLATKNKSTALHLAALKGHAAIVKFLLDSGVPITHNILQASFLDLAILYKHSTVASEAVKHDRWEECLDLVSPMRSPPIIELIETLPDVALSVMDRSISSQLLPTHTGHYKIYNFKYISMGQKVSSERRDTNLSGFCQLIWYYVLCVFTLIDDKSQDVIKAILKSNHADVFLTHPLPVTYINLKWRNYGRLYIQMRGAVPTILTILLTVLVLLSSPPRPGTPSVILSMVSNLTGSNSTELPTTSNADDEDLNEDIPYYFTSVVLFIYALVLLIQGIMIIRLRKAFHRIHYFIEIGTVGSTAFFLFVRPTEWLAGVVALSFAWIGINLFSRYFDVMGLYTIMFYELLLRIGKAILVGLYYIIVFGLIMYILIGEEYFYDNPLKAIYATSFSVISGFNIDILRVKHTAGTLQYVTATFLVALTLTVVLTVALQSLMIGIAVRSIGSIKKDAIATQARLKVILFLEIDPNIPQTIKHKFIPRRYKVKEGKSMTTAIRNIWNHITSVFATKVEGEEEIREAQPAILDDMHQNMMQMETQIRTLQKQQDAMLAELKKLNLQTNSTTTTVI